MDRTRLATLLAALLVCALVVGAVPAVGQEDRVDIDADHPLTSASATEEYARDGVVSANLTRVDATLTISETSSDAGIDGFNWDFNNDFVCLDYRDLPRTVRVYLPAEMIRPRPQADLQSVTSSATADLEPTANREYTALTVRFDRAQRACWTLSTEAGIYFDAKDWGFGIVNNSTGFQLPRIGGGEAQWQHVDDTAFVNNSTVAVPVKQQSVTMQYDATAGENESTWLSVPTCSDIETQPVCRFTRENETGTIHLLSTQNDPPPVRYKHVRDPMADVRSWAEDLAQVPGRILETFDGLWGGDS